MSNLSSIAREAGFNAILSISGECLILMTGLRAIYSVTGVVNRGGEESPIEKGAVDWDERNRSTVEIPKCVPSIPEVGSVWRDSGGRFHRIKSIKATDISYRMVCEPSAPDDDE